jgi:hypothetical protein
LLDLGLRMLAVLCAGVPGSTEVVAVEAAFAVPLPASLRGSKAHGWLPAPAALECHATRTGRASLHGQWPRYLLGVGGAGQEATRLPE